MGLLAIVMEEWTVTKDCKGYADAMARFIEKGILEKLDEQVAAIEGCDHALLHDMGYPRCPKCGEILMTVIRKEYRDPELFMISHDPVGIGKTKRMKEAIANLPPEDVAVVHCDGRVTDGSGKELPCRSKGRVRTTRRR